MIYDKELPSFSHSKFPIQMEDSNLYSEEDTVKARIHKWGSNKMKKHKSFLMFSVT